MLKILVVCWYVFWYTKHVVHLQAVTKWCETQHMTFPAAVRVLSLHNFCKTVKLIPSVMWTRKFLRLRFGSPNWEWIVNYNYCVSLYWCQSCSSMWMKSHLFEASSGPTWCFLIHISWLLHHKIADTDGIRKVWFLTSDLEWSERTPQLPLEQSGFSLGLYIGRYVVLSGIIHLNDRVSEQALSQSYLHNETLILCSFSFMSKHPSLFNWIVLQACQLLNWGSRKLQLFWKMVLLNIQEIHHSRPPESS